MKKNPPCPVPFALPFIGREEEEAALRALRSGWLTTGKEALAFENEFAAFLRRGAETPPYCLAVNSATSGLHLALEACGVRAGDAVFVPSYTFTSTAEVARYLGAEPVFVDSLDGGFNIDPAALGETVGRLLNGADPYTGKPSARYAKLTPRAVVPVHFAGEVCDMDAINRTARRHNLKIIEDAAHAFPSLMRGESPPRSSRLCGTDAVEKNASGEVFSQEKLRSPQSAGMRIVETSPLPGGAAPKPPYGTTAEKNISIEGRYAGTLGDAGVFSFYATKTITTGEGGMVVSADKAIADRISVMRSHGIDRSVWNRYTDTKASWYYEVIEAGYKYNLPDLLAAIGRAQLARADALLAMREAIAARYDEAFSRDERFIVPPVSRGHARHLYPLRLNPSALAVSRDDFIAALREQDVGVSVHFIPLHTMPFYRERYAIPEAALPRALAAFKQVVSLPIWPGMSNAQIERVIAVVKETAR